MVTIPLILMTLMFDPGVILGGEIRCMSLLGSKWFTTNEYRDQLVMMIKSRILQTKLRIERRNGWFCKKQPVSHYLSLETPRGPGGIILWVNHHRFISVCAGDKLVELLLVQLRDDHCSQNWISFIPFPRSIHTTIYIFKGCCKSWVLMLACVHGFIKTLLLQVMN